MIILKVGFRGSNEQKPELANFAFNLFEAVSESGVAGDNRNRGRADDRSYPSHYIRHVGLQLKSVQNNTENYALTALSMLRFKSCIKI